jgi:hypothetical protein
MKGKTHLLAECPMVLLLQLGEGSLLLASQLLLLLQPPLQLLLRVLKQRDTQ